jgi:hypothetical protein
VTKDAYFRIGIFILALCAITWMLLSNSWGAEAKGRSSLGNFAGRLVDRDRASYPSIVDCNDRHAPIIGEVLLSEIYRMVLGTKDAAII